MSSSMSPPLPPPRFEMSGYAPVANCRKGNTAGVSGSIQNFVAIGIVGDECVGVCM